MYWLASCPQPVAAPLCFGLDGIRDGTAMWGQSFTVFPAAFQVNHAGALPVPAMYDWTQMCVPFPMQCSAAVAMAPQFVPCVVPPMCCTAHTNSAAMTPQAFGAEGSSPLSFGGVDASPDITLDGLQLLPTETGVSQRWADIVDEEPSTQLYQVESEVQQETNSAARRRRRQRTTDVVQDCVADAPVQQSMEQVKQIDEHSGEVDRARTCVQKLADWVVTQLGAGGMTREATVASAHQLATSDKNSCRAMQLALGSAPAKDAAALALGLRGRVRETIQSMHGNYVLQKIIEVVPASVSSFIVEELLGVAAEVSRHRFGCRVLCRLLEHLSPSDQCISSLVDEILRDAVSLCRHTYGNFVVQHILEFGLADQQHEVVSALSKDLRGNARNQHASHGIEKALSFCPVNDRDAILEELFQDSNNLLELAGHQFGCYVVRALLKLPDGQLAKVEDRLRPIAAQLGESNRRQRRIAAGAADRAAARGSFAR